MFKNTLKTLAGAALMLGCCASAQAELVRTVRTSAVMGYTGTRSYETVAWCQPGEMATGGGYVSGYGVAPRIDDNAPASDGSLQGWRVRFTVSLSADPLQPSRMVGGASVICLKAQ